MLKSLVVLAVSLSSLLIALPALATGQDPVLEPMNKPYMVRCNGVPMHKSELPWSPCAGQEIVAKASAPKIAPMPRVQLPEGMYDLWNYIVSDAVWVSSLFGSGTLTGDMSVLSWQVQMSKNVQVYPADSARGWPEVTMRSGVVIDACGSGSGAVLTIETPTPEIAQLDIRVDLCGVLPVNGIHQVWLESDVALFTTDWTGIHRTFLEDNRALNGKVLKPNMYGGKAEFKRQ